jgi:hypothetical protein
MATLNWKLREYLKKHKITTLALEAKAETVSRVTLYRLTSPDPGKRPQRIDIPTLSAIIKGLRSLTGDNVMVSDLLEYQEG